jgi:polysaccharide biosynthesis/export protein
MSGKLFAFGALVAAAPGLCLAAQPQQPTGTAAPAPAATAYRINPGDEIEVHVWGEERLQLRRQVLPDGSFSFPLVGRIEAANKLPSEIEEAVTARLTSQYREAVPFVTVSVLAPSGMRFSIVGKVRSPGTFTPGRYVNALEALALAGGGTEFARLDRVVIIRKSGNGLVSMRVRLDNLLEGDVSAVAAGGIPQIQGGDTVVVP